ncbi:unnamed protein product [Oppiella nova]|uniref:Uncharacterized protein n=1 Tax=Oppiella nova TaxID=334625 RepID=A0A7R9M9P0_9ACAR|nr:unnamed protein product [Oppiella nova]CAG2173309.1 unnamed protein product [Oppiella nova]
MLRLAMKSVSCVINCVWFQLLVISVQMMAFIVCDSNHNQTHYEFMANQLFSNSSLLDIKRFAFEYNSNKTVNICDTIDCNINLAFCELNQCLGMKDMGKLHYAVTCIIVAGVIVLLMATIYACHKENKRSIQWRTAHNRCEQHREQMMTLRILQTLIPQNRDAFRPYPEAIPLHMPNEAPPPYQLHYTPPPEYREATRHHHPDTEQPK